MKSKSIFFRKPSERNTSSVKLNALHEAQDAAYWRGEYENAIGRVARLDKEREKRFREVITLRAALADIRNQGIKSASGTARAMARKAGEALK